MVVSTAMQRRLQKGFQKKIIDAKIVVNVQIVQETRNVPKEDGTSREKQHTFWIHLLTYFTPKKDRRIILTDLNLPSTDIASKNHPKRKNRRTFLL
jgi:hypothetical protein